MYSRSDSSMTIAPPSALEFWIADITVVIAAANPPDS